MVHLEIAEDVGTVVGVETFVVVPVFAIGIELV